MRKLFYLIFIVFLLNSCERESVLKSDESTLVYEVTTKGDSLIAQNDSIIISRKINCPTIVSASKYNKLTHKYFLNDSCDRVGTEIYFDDEYMSKEVYFWLDSTNLLFRSDVTKNNNFQKTEGHPWYIHGADSASVGDTIDYFIAAPIIDDIVTKITFRQNESRKSEISYNNDLRQMTLRKVVNSKSNVNLKLIVSFLDNDTIVYSDSTSFLLYVR